MPLKLFYIFFLIFSLPLLAFGNEDLVIPMEGAYPLLAEQIQKWILDLGNSDSTAREKAQKNLIRLERAAFPLLRETLLSGSSNINLKIGIIRVITAIPGQGRSEILISLLSKKGVDDMVYAEAVSSLGEIGDETFVDDLLRYAYHSNPQIGNAGANALCRMKGKKAIRALIELLRYGSSEVRIKALRALENNLEIFVSPQNRPNVTIGLDYNRWLKWWQQFHDTLEDTGE